MNFNPLKWKLPQYLTVITALLFIYKRTTLKFNVPEGDGLSSTAIYYAFVVLIPKLVSLVIILTLMISLFYTFGLYFDITWTYLLIRLAIPLGIMVVEGFLYFMFSQVLELHFFFKNFLIQLFFYGLYFIAMAYCYKKVEFRLVDMDEIETIKEDYRHHQRELQKSNSKQQRPQKSSHRKGVQRAK